MYLAHHIALGTAIAFAGFAIAGPVSLVATVPLAIGSHWVLDWIGETGYGPLFSKEWFKWEVIPILIIALGVYLSGLWWLGLIGAIAGSFMDLWDKGWSKIKYGHWFADPGVFHRNNPPIVTANRNQTKYSAIIAAVVILLFGILL